jgi:hypothetical protein
MLDQQVCVAVENMYAYTILMRKLHEKMGSKDNITVLRHRGGMQILCYKTQALVGVEQGG